MAAPNPWSVRSDPDDTDSSLESFISQSHTELGYTLRKDGTRLGRHNQPESEAYEDLYDRFGRHKMLIFLVIGFAIFIVLVSIVVIYTIPRHAHKLNIESVCTFCCPKVGRWTPWTTWSPCINGTRSKARVYDTPSVSKMCPFSEKCVPPKSPPSTTSPGTWSKWSSWQSCSQSCESGESKRERKCERGRHCNGASHQSRYCKLGRCDTFRGSKYYYPRNVTLDWSKAKTFCEKLWQGTGTLVVALDSTADKYLTSQLTGNNSYWLDAKLTAKEWKWSALRCKFSQIGGHSDWTKNQKQKKGDNLCLEKTKVKTGSWSAARCDKKNKFVCEQKLPGTQFTCK